MTPERLKKIEEIYHAILDIPPPLRKIFLQNTCDGDVELQQEVESLLPFEDKFDNVIDTPPKFLIKEVLENQLKTESIESNTQTRLIKIPGQSRENRVETKPTKES